MLPQQGRQPNQTSEELAMRSYPYLFKAIPGGFEIHNSPFIYNRPLYGSHVRDRESWNKRVSVILGDNTNILVNLIDWESEGAGAAKLAHIFLGIGKGNESKWFADFDSIITRYFGSEQEWELSDPFIGDKPIILRMVRPVRFEGVLITIDTSQVSEPLEIYLAAGGAKDFIGNTYDYQLEKGSVKDFHPEDCVHNEIIIQSDIFSIKQGQADHGKQITGMASTPFQYRKVDAKNYAAAPHALYTTQGKSAPMIIGKTNQPLPAQIYIGLITDDASLPEVQPFLEQPDLEFEAARNHFKQVTETLIIDTPREVLDSGVRVLNMALDAIWHEPCYRHGAWSWTHPYAGWRMCYGPTVMGWHDRVQQSTATFFPFQENQPELPEFGYNKESGFPKGYKCRGAIPHFPKQDEYFYNMGEILVDHILYEWEWSGDRSYIESAFMFIHHMLEWEQKVFDPDGDGLYEN